MKVGLIEEQRMRRNAESVWENVQYRWIEFAESTIHGPANRNILIPSDPIFTCRLRDDVKTWIKQNMDYEVSIEARMRWSYTLVLHFQSDRDYVLFKTFWL